MNTPEDDTGISPRGLAARLARGDAPALLDVREPRERDYCAIPQRDPGAVDLHVPIREVAARAGEIAAARRGKTLVVYCHHGVRSRAVVDWLAANGEADVLNLEGGIDAWSVEVDPGVRRY